MEAMHPPHSHTFFRVCPCPVVAQLQTGPALMGSLTEISGKFRCLTDFMRSSGVWKDEVRSSFFGGQLQMGDRAETAMPGNHPGFRVLEVSPVTTCDAKDLKYRAPVIDFCLGLGFQVRVNGWRTWHFFEGTISSSAICLLHGPQLSAQNQGILVKAAIRVPTSSSHASCWVPLPIRPPTGPCVAGDLARWCHRVFRTWSYDGFA